MKSRQGKIDKEKPEEASQPLKQGPVVRERLCEVRTPNQSAIKRPLMANSHLFL